MAENKKRRNTKHQVPEDQDLNAWTAGPQLVGTDFHCPSSNRPCVADGLLHFFGRLPDSRHQLVEHGDRPGHHDGGLPDDAPLAMTC